MSEHAIQFSGGKDSLAVLYQMRPLLDRATVYFGDTGGVYPHMVEFVHDTCRRLGAKLRVVNPTVPLDIYHARFGLPSDIVPVEASVPMRLYNGRSGQMLQSNLSCCNTMLWQPMQQALIADGIKHVYRGSKACDGHVGVPDGFVDSHGITYHSPIWSWSDADVFTYLQQIDASLPEHHGDVDNSFDCLFCTAFLKNAGARERLEYTREHYPKEWPELKRRLSIVRAVVDSEREAIDDALSLAGE